MTDRTALTRRAAMVAGVAGVAGVTAGCSLQPDRDHAGSDAPTSLPLARKPRIAWVLGSGGPRGVVHVGVIKAMEELRLVPDLIVGASIGAVVGAFRASGLDASSMEALALNVTPWQIGRLAWGTSERVSSLGISDWVNASLDHRRLQALPLPFACAAYNTASRELVALTAGNTGLAVAASCAIEGRLTPVRIRGDLYVDADLHQPLPVRLARALGAERVMAVDVSAHETRAPTGTERWREGDLKKRALTAPDARSADVLLHPDSGYFASIAYGHRQTMIQVGYEATMAQADKLRAMHAR